MSGGIITDQRIASLLGEAKDWVDLTRYTPTKRKRAHLQGRIPINGAFGSRFEIFVRMAILDPTDFTVGLGWHRPDVTGLFHLLRCNGSSHDHPNRIEGNVVEGFHIHVATERYQALGEPPEGYAYPAEYSDFRGAVEAFIDLTGITRPAQLDDLTLFDL
jgi:hypothetical protein